MAHARLVLVAAAAVALAGCASVQQRVGGWFGETPPPAAQQGASYFSAVDGLPVHAEASRSAKVVGRLALHEKVVRSRLEAGWAYVVAEGSDVSGWVDNAQLIWRLPAPDAATTPAAAAPPPAEDQQPAAPAATATPAPAPPAPEPTLTATPTPAPAPTTAPTATAAPQKAAPAMFDPY